MRTLLITYPRTGSSAWCKNWDILNHSDISNHHELLSTRKLAKDPEQRDRRQQRIDDQLLSLGIKKELDISNNTDVIKLLQLFVDHDLTVCLKWFGNFNQFFNKDMVELLTTEFDFKPVTLYRENMLDACLSYVVANITKQYNSTPENFVDYSKQTIENWELDKIGRRIDYYFDRYVNPWINYKHISGYTYERDVLNLKLDNNVKLYDQHTKERMLGSDVVDYIRSKIKDNGYKDNSNWL